MTYRASASLALALCLAALPLAPAMAETASTVHITVWDKGGDALDQLGDIPPMGMAMGGAQSGQTMGLKLDTAEVKAGEVTLEVDNSSKDFIHEVVVAPVADPNAPLPYSADENAVDEDAAGAIGEVSELDAGAKGQVTLHLAPGEYILFCNVPGHYAMGMWSLLKVDA